MMASGLWVSWESMSRTLLLHRPSHGVVLFRLVWPTAMLFALTLAAVFGTITWTSRSANESAADHQRVHLQGAVAAALAALSDHLSELGSGDALVGDRHASPHFDTVSVLRPKDTSLLPQDISASLVGEIRSLAGARAQTAAFVSEGAFFGAVAIRPLGPDAGGPVLVGIKRFGEAQLRQLAEPHGIESLRIALAPPDHHGFLPVVNAAGATRAFLAWAPDRPGDLIRERVLPVMLFGSAVSMVLLVLLILAIRRLAQDLAHSEEQAQILVGLDPLSSLPNRLLFTDRLDQEISRLGRAEGGIAVMFLDLDRFKDVNDTYGHAAGDELIKQVAQRLSDLLRGADTLARFGGDEFAVIQTGIRSAADAEALARRVLDAIGRPFEIAGAQVSVGVSIGIALAPENGMGHEVLMRLADTALYESKSEGRNRFSFFQRTMDEAIRMRKVVEDDLRHAIQRDELTLHYQPLYSADGRTIVGVEALVRWPHPKQGMISPANFISIAEERGLVIPLGEWVLRRACQDGQRWPGLRIAVNVSPLQFRHRDFVASVVRTLRETNFDPTRLELELTEGVVVEDADAAEAAMMELRALGVNLALDDFGTGYSSLIYLRRFAFDKIKIDRSFLESMEATGESAILVHSIVHLGRALGLTVTAEGVETREQHRFLQALGCHQLQGFLFSKPVPPAQIDLLLGGAAVAAKVA